MKLYFARHGESKANVQQVYWNQPQRYGLTAKGREQAEALATHLAGIQFTALYWSSILRAAQTAQIVGQRLGLTPQVADGLRTGDTTVTPGAPQRPRQCLAIRRGTRGGRLRRRAASSGGRQERRDRRSNQDSAHARVSPYLCAAATSG